MSAAQLLFNNFTDTEVVTQAWVSSEQTLYPSVNLYNKYRRSKIWRSNGNWVIPGGSNVLIFRETTGVDLTATITATTYTTTSLLAAIKAAMQSAGGSTYTLSVDATTKKIKFVSNGVGGGGIFQLRFDDILSLGMSQILGFTATAKTGALTHNADLIRCHTEEWIKWDFGTASNVKAFVAAGVRNLPLKISTTAVVTLQANDTDVWTSPQYSQVVTYDPNQLVLFGATGLTTPRRYWRLLINDAANVNGYVELGLIYLGDAYSPTRGAVQFPFNPELVDLSTTVRSESGVAYSLIKPKSERFRLTWSALTYVEKEMLDAIFAKFGTTRPLFFALDSEAAFSSSQGYYVRWVRFTKEPSSVLENPNFFAMAMEIQEDL